MENQNSQATARDFFLHLGAMAALYAVGIALVNLLFTVIDEAYPIVTQVYNYYYPASSVSLPVATLIIVFPIFILLSWLTYKSYEINPLKKDLAVRRWLTYITLFVAGIILAGDLVTVLYKFLDGQDLTTAFLLKALVVLIVAGGVFKFYIDEIRDVVTKEKRKVWTVSAAVVIIISIVFGFSVLGSPQTQRLVRYDNIKVSDLQNIQWQVISYWQRKGELPKTIVELNDPISNYTLPVDPQTNSQYEYNYTGGTTFELCAMFNKPSNTKLGSASMMRPYGTDMMSENWMHGANRTCFKRVVDPTLYPVTKPNIVR